MTDPSQSAATENGRAHLQAWFPVAFEKDLEPGTLERITVFDAGFVLFRSRSGHWKGLEDRCPHRSARLSDGRLRGGELECMYHGWRFDAEGECTHIPQLPKNSPIPSKACTTSIPVESVQGILWIWPGQPGAQDPSHIPRIPGLEDQGMHTIDYTSDLPYGQEAFNENVLDFAHIHVAHDGVRGGGHRQHAGPLAFTIEDQAELGFTAEFQSPSANSATQEARPSGATVTFRAPGLVHYRSVFGKSERCSGLALFSIPLGHDRSRMLYRAYSNFWPQKDLSRKRWREHLFQMDLLEQDMAVVMGQVKEIQGDARALKNTWLPIKTSDPLVLHYRGWIDRHALNRPGSVGWSQRGPAAAPSPPTDCNRLDLHTRHCSACRAALVRLRTMRRALVIAPILLTMAAALLGGPLALMAVTLSIFSLAWALRCNRFILLLIRSPLPTSKTLLTHRW